MEQSSTTEQPSIEEYFLQTLDLSNAKVRCKIFDESVNCNKLRFVFTLGAIDIWATVSFNFRKQISAYDLICDLIDKHDVVLQRRFSELMNQQLRTIVPLLNDAITSEKKRVAKAYNATQEQCLFNVPDIHEQGGI